MSPRQQKLLIGILTDRERYASLTPQYGRERSIISHRMKIEDAQLGLVSMAPSHWLGVSLTASLSTMVSRDYQTLEGRGLIVRHRLKYSDRQTSHLSLTPAGEAIARELLAADYGGVDASGFCITGTVPEGTSTESTSSQDPADA